MSAADLSFHQSTVVAFERRQNVVRLALSEVRSAEQLLSVRAEVRAVTTIVADGVEIDDVRMEHPDGEVLTLEVFDEELYLIIQWNDFANRHSFIRSYRIRGSVAWSLGE